MTTTQTPVAAVSGLRYQYPGRKDAALSIERLDVRPSAATLLYGPSGCGKSTLLSLLAGILVAGSGTVQLLGIDWADIPARARDSRRADHIGYVFQQFNLLGWMSAIDNVMLGCTFSRRRATQAIAGHGDLRRAAAAALGLMQLPRSRWDAPGGQLSVGEQQRVAAARALIGSPELILADEPTSALDEALRDRFIHNLLEASALTGSALLVVSHDRALAEHFPSSLHLPDSSGQASKP
jgi:putative ABC transport system ATP-binding protein